MANADPNNNLVSSAEPSIRVSTTAITDAQTSITTTNQTVQQTDASLPAQASANTSVEIVEVEST